MEDFSQLTSLKMCKNSCFVLTFFLKTRNFKINFEIK